MCVVAPKEVDAQAPAAGNPRVGGASSNQDIRARSKSARGVQAQVAVKGGERREEEGGEGRGREGRGMGKEGKGKGWKEESEASVGASGGPTLCN